MKKKNIKIKPKKNVTKKKTVTKVLKAKPDTFIFF